MAAPSHRGNDLLVARPVSTSRPRNLFSRSSFEPAFAYLRAGSAKPWVLEDNHASVSVSTKLGYALIDRHDITEDGRGYIEHVYQLDCDTWLLRSPIRREVLPAISGAQPLAELLTL